MLGKKEEVPRERLMKIDETPPRSIIPSVEYLIVEWAIKVGSVKLIYTYAYSFKRTNDYTIPLQAQKFGLCVE